MKAIPIIAFLILLFPTAYAQVDQIKSASTQSGSGTSKGGSNDTRRGGRSTGGNIYIMFDFFRLVGSWQRDVLSKRDEIPSLVGLDLMAHAAIQPSSYYVLNPRLRGTWGIFSTDFRTNHLIEESIDGYKYLYSFDWQVVQLNFINTKHVIVRAGTGFMKENFGSYRTFNEHSVSSNLMFNENEWGGFAEYRWATDSYSGLPPRSEVNLQVHKQLFEAGRWHGLASGGIQYQRYYDSVNVWGIQMGLVFRVY